MRKQRQPDWQLETNAPGELIQAWMPGTVWVREAQLAATAYGTRYQYAQAEGLAALLKAQGWEVELRLRSQVDNDAAVRA